MTTAVSRIEHGGGFADYENEEMEVDHSENAEISQIPSDFRLHERLFLRKIDKLIAPVRTEKRKWDPLEESGDALGHTAPLERYMAVSTQRLVQKFFADLSVGDILIGEIQSWRRNLYDLTFVALDGGQARCVPANINIFCDIPQVRPNTRKIFF